MRQFIISSLLKNLSITLLLITGILDRVSKSTEHMKKILILQPNLDQSISIAKFLKAYANDFYIIGGYYGGASIPKIPYFDKIERISENTSLNFSKYDIILPTGANSTKTVLSQMKTIKVGNIEFNENNLLVFDKIKMLNIVVSMGIPVPVTYCSIDEIIEYPIFYKQAYETGSGQRGVLRNDKELTALKFKDHSLIFQEYIDSPYTFGVGFLANEGRLIISFIQKELMSFPRSGGSGVVLEKYEDDRLIRYTETILKNLNYSGWGLAEFKYCKKRNDYVFMEVNAKLWASIEFALINDPDFFKELFDIRYAGRNIQCIVYLNRLANYGLLEYIKYGLKYKNCCSLNFKDSLSILSGYYSPVKIIKKIKDFFITDKI